jgi:hypothetical protein
MVHRITSCFAQLSSLRIAALTYQTQAVQMEHAGASNIKAAPGDKTTYCCSSLELTITVTVVIRPGKLPAYILINWLSAIRK